MIDLRTVVSRFGVKTQKAIKVTERASPVTINPAELFRHFSGIA